MNSTMMRFSIVILTFALQQQCSALNPENARQKAETGLKPYFPHAHAVLSGSTLLGITCADLGPAAIRELPQALDNNASVRQLKTFGGLMGIRSFALGFPDNILELNLATKQYQVFPAATILGYARDYATLCNATSSSIVQPQQNVVRGYPMLDANRIYRIGEQVRVEEPSGVHTGVISMDASYFVRPVNVTIAEQNAIGSKGTVLADVRQATSTVWQRLTLSYGCDYVKLMPGQNELARMGDGGEMLIGRSNSGCGLKPTTR